MSTTVSDEPASYTSNEKGQANLIHATKAVRDASKSAVPELRRLSTLSVKKDLSDLSIPTITENAEDVAGKLNHYSNATVLRKEAEVIVRVETEAFTIIESGIVK